ncbi:right-handed parallel beta-helix repeat-containing protein [candidate division KSB1 bacterium]|nr:right-handed parallel beta-helix repeat-containing protein [candidate division KSB1 bacterium]
MDAKSGFSALFCLILLLVTIGTAQDQHFYVAPTGNDDNPGTLEAPFGTLEKARDAIRESKKNAHSPTSGYAVLLRGGTHFRDRVFQLDHQDSGQDGAPIRYAAYNGEKPVLISAKAITGWRPLSGSIKGMRPEAHGQIYEANVDKGWNFHFLFINDKPQTLARLYNSDNWHDWPKPQAIGAVGANGQMLSFAEGELNHLSGLDGQIEINLMPVNYWNTISVLYDIDPPNSTAYRHSKNPTTFWLDSFQEGNYNLLNALAFIDEPGEWAVDSRRGKVYLWPESGTLGADDRVMAPLLYRLIEIRGDADKQQLVKHIEFEGLEFRYTDRMAEDQWPEEWIKRQAELPDAMIVIEDAENLVIQNCKFFYSGSYGIDLEKHAQRIRIVANEMAYMGCGGILLQGYGPGLKDVNKNNILTRNHIHHTGQSGYLHSAAITLYQSGSNEISLNILRHIPYVGIQICGANWNAYGPNKLAQSLDKQEPGGVDSYGNARAQYATRWQDLPAGRESTFTRENFKKYLHTSNNKIHHNMVIEYLEKLSDGAPLYSWSTGMGNLFDRNLMQRRDIEIPQQKWIFALYMDDYVDGAVLTDNRVWGPVCTAESSPGLQLISKDRVWGQPYSDNAFYNKGLNLWSGNIQSFPQKPAGYDDLMREIVSLGLEQGGWPGDLPAHVSELINRLNLNEKE